MTNDLTAARVALQQGRTTAADALATSLRSADGPANAHTYLKRFDAQARAAAVNADACQAAGVPLPPLAGLAVSVKALFDVQGHITAAGSRVLADAPPAQADCAAVARLRAAGAALTGHTNMTEFAFSGVGINPHHGTPPNPATLAMDPEPRIPGGSTSGGAVSVASGAAWAALGSDTGGSIRIPAALQGLVGFKNTARLTPTEGAIPLSTTLDTACAITRSVRDAVLLHEVLAARHVGLAARPLHLLRLAIPTPQLDGMDPTVASAFERAISSLRQAGAQIDTIALRELAELATINATGGFSAAESWAWHRHLLAQRQVDYDPRVALRIRRGETMSAADYIDLTRARADWISRMTLTMRRYDALISPTVPIVAPTIESLASDDVFFATNALLLRNPSVVNMLDGCALSLPCHSPDEMPVGLMVWSHALQDDTVLDASLAIEAALAKGLA
ncbi:amidase [Piscinibacter sp. HJYY11]|uniref:amidase n=1 Tax=Piscinibacter sp. HJYY11 TaxID=2801333 RepID=UPI00191D671A|nr:amidase [Piscinibacter sp. HJYY11]MBL0726763.1 amidase [Piscinibacter sp. HJYY11]